jgi:hypothetical protein
MALGKTGLVTFRLISNVRLDVPSSPLDAERLATKQTIIGNELHP